MRRSILIIGLIILVIGISLIAVVRFGAISEVSRVVTFNQRSPGEYISGELVLTGPSVVAVKSPASDGGLIPSQDLSAINSVNVGKYAVSYSSTAAGVETYNGITGDYYYVVFSSSPPATQVVVASLSSTGKLIMIGVLALSGLGLIFLGLIVAIVGVLSKNPKKDPRAVI